MDGPGSPADRIDGHVDGPAEGGLSVPRWERVRLELRVENRLRLEVHNLELDVALVSPGDGTTVIPGWSFRTQATAVLPPNEITYLRIARELPARRTSPPADEIAYRVQIRSYRLHPPDLPTAIELLGSPTRSDQRAVLRSYQPLGDRETEKVLGDELAHFTTFSFAATGWPSIIARSFSRARESRDITVPIGMPRVRATCS